MKRVEDNVARPASITVLIDGVALRAHPGETVAVAVLASDTRRFRDDRGGRPRGMFCNMGTCAECTVWIARGDGPWRRLRACLVPVEPGLRIATGDPEAAA
ncbi:MULTISPECIES: (2Fe-2S)-binding protein [unclassified Sphingomonas]|uniref:(2Fe-2S)-binding protein n=1 Tax=Novosphingobium rhizosphaerae TaxID=1551649 RepID=UPI0015C7BD45